MKSQKYQLTRWQPIGYIIDSEYGKITYKEWCKKEAQRIGQCFIKEKKSKGIMFVAVFKERK